MSFAPLPRRRLPRTAGALQVALDLFAPVVAAPRIAERPSLSLVPALPVAPAPVVVEPVSAPVAPAVPAPAPVVDEPLSDGVFRVEVLVPGPLGVGFPVRESVVGRAPSARAARVDAADDGARPVAVWALVGSSETLVWGAAA